jgi:hypothetical protein
MTREQERAVVRALTAIAERAEIECEMLKRAGEKQGVCRRIAGNARSALRYWTNAEIDGLLAE